MKRYWLSVFACLCLALALLPTAALAAGDDDGDGGPGIEDAKGDEKPDCTHENTKWVRTEDGEKHYKVCLNCNEKCSDEEMHDYKTGKAGFCICGAECKHWNREYTAILGAEKHIWKCTACKKEVTEDHDYDEKGKCTACKASEPLCTHEGTGRRYTDKKNGKEHIEICLKCNSQVEFYAPHVFENGVCVCGACNHEGTERFYEPINDKTHLVRCKKCGGDVNKSENHTYKDGVCVCGAKESTPTTPGETPERLTLTPTTGGVDKQVTVTIPAGHWLTIQVTRENSIAISSVEAPIDGDGKITFSAATGSKVQVWETAVKMKFNANGAPTSPIFSTGQTTL